MKSGSKKNSSGGVSFGGSSNTSGGASSSATSGPSFNRNQRAQVFVNTMEICAPNGPFGCLPPPEPSELYSHSDQKFSDIDRLRETAARERNSATATPRTLRLTETHFVDSKRALAENY
jgi:hypothetical protein